MANKLNMTLLALSVTALAGGSAHCEPAKWLYRHTSSNNGSFSSTALTASEPEQNGRKLILGITVSTSSGNYFSLISNRPLPYCRSSCVVKIYGLGDDFTATEISLDEHDTAYVLSGASGDDLFTAFSEAGELDFKFLSDSSSQIYRFRLDGYNPNEMQFQP